MSALPGSADTQRMAIGTGRVDHVDQFSAEQRDLLFELSLLINERRGVDETFATFADQIRHGITFDSASLFVATEDPRFIRTVGHYPDDFGIAAGTIFRADQMGWDQLGASLPEAEYIPRKLDLSSTRALAERGYERAWVTPLLVDGENYGMLTVAKKAHGRFPEEHLKFLRTAATLLARAVRQDLELQRARRMAARASAASQLILALQAGEGFRETFDRLPALLEPCLDLGYVGLIINEGDGFALATEWPTGIHQDAVRTAEDDARMAVRAQQGDFLEFRLTDEPKGGQRLYRAGFRRASLAFLLEDGEFRGALSIARTAPRPFNQDEREFIELLSSILSQSLANQRRLARTEVAAARARALNEIALLVNAGQDVDAVFNRLLTLVDQAMQLDYTGLLQVTGPGMLAMVGSSPELLRPRGTAVSRDELAFDKVLAMGRSFVQYKIANHLERSPDGQTLFDAGLRRAATILVREGDDVLGLLTMARRVDRRFSPEEEAFLETLAAMLAQAIANGRRLTQAQTEAARNGLLNDLAVLLNRGEPPEAFFASVSAQLQRVVPVDSLVLLVAGEEPGVFRVVDSLRGGGYIPQQRLRLEDFGEAVHSRLVNGETVAEGETAGMIGRAGESARAAGLARSALAAVRDGTETVGFLMLGRRANVEFSADECAFIELVCVLVGQAIANRLKVEAKEAEARRSHVLSELAVLLQGGGSIERHFPKLVEILLRPGGFDFVSVSTPDPDSGDFAVMRSHALAEKGQSVGLNVDAMRAMKEPGRAVQYRTASVGQAVTRAIFEAGFLQGATAMIVGPEGDDGLLSVGRRSGNRFSAEEMRFIELVAALLGQAAANHRESYTREADLLRSRVLSELALLLNNGEPIATHFERLRDLLREGVGFDFCSVAVRGAEGEAFRLMTSEPLPQGGEDSATVAELTNVEATAADPPKAASAALMQAMGIHRSASFVLSAGSGPEGLLTVGRRSDSAFTTREIAFFEVVATLLAHAAANERRLTGTAAEARDQTITAEAARAVARNTTALGIVRGLRAAVGSFIPLPFVNFGYLDGEVVHFPTRDGRVQTLHVDRYFNAALSEGQAVVPSTSSRVAAGETNLHEMEAIGIEGHVLTRATSAGAVTGLLVVGSRDPSFVPGEREFRLCRLIADIVGPAMANARGIERERHEAEEQRVIAEVSAVAAREPEPAALILGLQKPLEGIVPLPLVSFAFREAEDVLYVSYDGTTERGPINQHLRRTEERGQVWGSEPPEGAETANLRTDGAHALSATAVRASGATVGYLLIASREPGFEFSDRELRLFRVLSQIVGPAMANARAAVRARQDAEEQGILAQAAAAAARARDFAELTASLVAPMRRIVPSARMQLFYLDPDTHSVNSIAGTFPIGPQVERALETGQAEGRIDGPDLLESLRTLLRRRGIRKWVQTVAVSSGDALGLLWVGTSVEEYLFSERDLRLLRLIADIVGPAMANLRESARRREEAEEQSILADSAAAIASGATELEIIQRLTVSVGRFVPGAAVTFSYVEGDEMLMFDGSRRRPLSDHYRLVLASGQVTAEFGTTAVTDAGRELLEGAGIVRWVDTAASSAGVPIGILFAGSSSADYRFSSRDLRLLRLIADITGPAMAIAREHARRRREAEDERILSEIAAVAARAGSAADVVDALAGLLEPLVPSALALYGFIEGDFIGYQVTRPELEASLGTRLLLLPLTEVGTAARDSGQAIGTMRDVPRERSYASLRLQQYSITSYSSAAAPVGALLVSTTDAEFRFDERTLSLLRRVVQVVGPAVESARAESERARQADLYSLILRSLSEAVILADLDGKVVFSNELGRRILRSLDPAGTVSHWSRVVDILPAGAREGYRSIFQDGVGSRGRASLEFDGSLHWFDYEMVPLNDPVMKMLLVAADVTADVEREAEQARHRDQMEQAQRLAALGELIGGVAHELNNPLTAILGFAEVMSLSEASAPLSEEIAIVQKEALRARNIVRDLLFIVRPGTSERSLIPFADLIGHIERLRRATWLQLGIRWEINIEEPCDVWGNEHQLTQVMLNLVSNAEYALAGRAERSLSIRGRSHGGGTEITVRDTGAGMDESTQSRVFEPFFTTKHGHGTGLGLPLSYSIVQAHDGEIRVASEPGVGTTFTLNLPSGPGEQVATVQTDTSASPDAVRVLVIDDEPSLRKVCQRLIASLGHECLTAESSAVAIELASTTDFDVVLCDYRLASETANEVVAGFERVAPRLVQRMVIATGATTDAGVVALTERYGLRLIAKPYGVDELAAIMRKAS